MVVFEEGIRNKGAEMDIIQLGLNSMGLGSPVFSRTVYNESCHRDSNVVRVCDQSRDISIVCVVFSHINSQVKRNESF